MRIPSKNTLVISAILVAVIGVGTFSAIEPSNIYSYHGGNCEMTETADSYEFSCKQDVDPRNYDGFAIDQTLLLEQVTDKFVRNYMTTDLNLSENNFDLDRGRGCGYTSADAYKICFYDENVYETLNQRYSSGALGDIPKFVEDDSEGAETYLYGLESDSFAKHVEATEAECTVKRLEGGDTVAKSTGEVINHIEPYQGTGTSPDHPSFACSASGSNLTLDDPDGLTVMEVSIDKTLEVEKEDEGGEDGGDDEENNNDGDTNDGDTNDGDTNDGDTNDGDTNDGIDSGETDDTSSEKSFIDKILDFLIFWN